MVMAKGVEDTTFYRWNRFVALNEVGGDPARFGVSRRSSTPRWPPARPRGRPR
jgi:maltooligosyltrehalose synthase